MDALRTGRARTVLIETLWNVKKQSHQTALRTSLRINRNIVECKEDFETGTLKNSISINRNIVECKDVYGSEDVENGTSVLIETLWNVKVLPQSINLLLPIVLIETLWNVKWIKQKWFAHFS